MDPNLSKIINLYNQKKLEEAKKICLEASEKNKKIQSFLIYMLLFYTNSIKI